MSGGFIAVPMMSASVCSRQSDVSIRSTTFQSNNDFVGHVTSNPGDGTAQTRPGYRECFAACTDSSFGVDVRVGVGAGVGADSDDVVALLCHAGRGGGLLSQLVALDVA